MLSLLQNTDPTWLTILERLGLPIFLVLFICAVAWKLLPHVVEWFKQGTVSAKIVADAIPDMRESLHQMAQSTLIGEEKLKTIEQKADQIHRNTEQILRLVEVASASRLPSS